MLRPSLGDAARHFTNMRRTNQVKTDLYRLTNELSSGKHADLPRTLGFARTRNAELTAQLTMNATFAQLGKEVESKLDTQQLAISQISEISGNLKSDLIALPMQPSRQDIARSAFTAESNMADMVNALRSSVGGQFVFSGGSTDTPPLPNGTTLIAHLRATIDLTQSSDDISQQVKTYFEDPAGTYETIHYSGTPPSSKPLKIGDGTGVTVSTTALDPALRKALSGFAIALLAGDLPDSETGKADALLQNARSISQDSSGLTSVGARIGLAQQKVETAQTRLAARNTAMQIEQNDLENVNPFETAVNLQDVQLQLEKHFSSLARLSQLSLIYHMP